MLYLYHFILSNNHPLYIELMFCIAIKLHKKGRRISSTSSHLSGFIFSYLRYFLMCRFLLHLIHTSSLKCICIIYRYTTVIRNLFYCLCTFYFIYVSCYNWSSNRCCRSYTAFHHMSYKYFFHIQLPEH